MFEGFFSYLCAHAEHAQYFLFGLLLLTGVNLPVSEELILMVGGIIVAVCIPGDYVTMMLWLYAGCILSAYEAYWIGRTIGPKLYDIRFFQRFITRDRVQKIGRFIERYGLMTFVVGRWMPGGVRNCLFVSSGLYRIPFATFAFRDGMAALFSSTMLFHIGYLFGSNYRALFAYFKIYHDIAEVIIGVLIGGTLLYFLFRKKGTGAL